MEAFISGLLTFIVVVAITTLAVWWIDVMGLFGLDWGFAEYLTLTVTTNLLTNNGYQTN